MKSSSKAAAALRRGFAQLVHDVVDRAREKGITINPIFSGDQDRTLRAFLERVSAQDKRRLCVLLVDSDEAVTGEKGPLESRRNHLLKKGKHQLGEVPPELIHLMVQVMETWIVSDPAALLAFYGRDFHENRLPQRSNLEEEPKDDLLKKLDAATRDTSKGKYHKINHACLLLEKIDAVKVAGRCLHFRLLTDYLIDQINAA